MRQLFVHCDNRTGRGSFRIHSRKISQYILLCSRWFCCLFTAG
ncbi:unnamed protein product [Schistosoma curassoni]|uniref:Uncharacterized protein n=1 Tax=Schistosoma curassoni TaxID=6186 RepID=A0A183L871_9TREM|nr:unnamed protein product [Schistosoma curassoni]